MWFSRSPLVSSFLFSLVVSLLDGATAAPTVSADPGGTRTPVSAILKPDGTLDLSTGFSGSVDVKGYRMVTDSGGVPRFVAATPDGLPLSAQPSDGLVAAAESDTNDVYWDDEFTINGASENVYSAAADGLGNLYIGGFFTAVGKVTANRVAKWNGTSWSALGAGVGGTNPAVRALAVSGTDLYAGGDFLTAGGASAKSIAKWNGTSWSPLGSGMAGGTHADVYAIVVNGTDVYAGGEFTSAGGVTVNRVAKWNGSAWSALGSGGDRRNLHRRSRACTESRHSLCRRRFHDGGPRRRQIHRKLERHLLVGAGDGDGRRGVPPSHGLCPRGERHRSLCGRLVRHSGRCERQQHRQVGRRKLVSTADRSIR